MSNKVYPKQTVEVNEESVIQTQNLIWNTNTLAWEKATGALTGANNIVTVNNFPAVQPINDNGSSLTVDSPQLPSALVGDRLKVDGSGVTQPISATALPLPSGASQEHTTAGSPNSVRLTDGSSFYKATTPSDTQPISGTVSINPIPTGSNLIGGVNLVDSAGVYKAKVSSVGSLFTQQDDSQLTAFGRTRSAQPFQLFSCKQDILSQDYLFTTSTANGGSSSYSADRASTTLTVTTANGSSSIRQSRAYLTYQPGKALLFLGTGVMGSAQTGTTKRIGYFDANNGLFFQLSGSTLSVVVRSKVTGSVVDTAINQSSWNLDKLDGTGASGITIDLTKVQIFGIDFQWLGSGRVRFGFDIGGQIIYCHQVTNANIISSVYMSTPNLPVRYEIFNSTGVASTASLEMICVQVTSEGGFDSLGIPYSCSNVAAAKTINATLLPILILRPKSTSPRPPVKIKDLSIMATSAASFFWGLYLNPTLSGGVAPTYNSVHADSYLEFDIASTHTVSAGKLLASGFGSSVDRTANLNLGNGHTLGLLSADFAGTTVDTLVLAAVSITGGSTAYHAALDWDEYA